MHSVLVMGAGKIGSLISVLLANSNDYKIYLSDIHIKNPSLERIISKANNLELVELDAKKTDEIGKFVKQNSIKTIVSALPYYCNIPIIKLAKEYNLNYFDLTEDTQTAKTATELSQ